MTARPARRAALPCSALALVAGFGGLVGLGAGCGKPPSIDKQAAANLFTEVPVATGNGLSGLAADVGGGLWTVAERDQKAYRITLDEALKPKVETYELRGVPSGTDLEGIAVLDRETTALRFALGTEAQLDGKAMVLLAERQGSVLMVQAPPIELPAAAVGIELKSNHGAEGICGGGSALIVAIEGAGKENGKRWAPVMRLAGDQVVTRFRVWLTSEQGKLSGLDCRMRADGSADVLAIERHFEVTKILRFRLPLSSEASVDITPEVALDLGPVLRSGLNLEGIAWTEEGQVSAVVDNQWTSITGPSELLVFKPGVVPAPQ